MCRVLALKASQARVSENGPRASCLQRDTAQLERCHRLFDLTRFCLFRLSMRYYTLTVC